ncbi:hypothetical protein I4U23_008334 [Adineta vaga]|nr:hypothetical protein I4U23_008334 [Adineta vaga]
MEALLYQLNSIQEKLQTYEVTIHIDLPSTITPKYTLKFECKPTPTNDTDKFILPEPSHLEDNIRKKSNHRHSYHPYNTTSNKVIRSKTTLLDVSLKEKRMTKTTNRCSVCHKGLGTSYCTGCGTCFCTKDFKTHRKALSNEMAGVITHRNTLRDRIERLIKSNDLHSPLLLQIDEWQEMMIEKVQLVAEQTRRQVTQLLNSKRTKLNENFTRFSYELNNLKETENFIEADLTRLKHKVHELNKELKHINEPITVELHTELSDQIIWDDLIYAKEKAVHKETQPQQPYPIEEPELESTENSPRKQPPKTESCSLQ